MKLAHSTSSETAAPGPASQNTKLPTMEIPLLQIDAFAERLFEGNPAAVMPLAAWLDDDVLQHLAAENNLSETAFYLDQIPRSAPAAPEPVPAYHLRWFTPAMEVDLCGHATLAAAAQLFEDVHPQASRLLFWTRVARRVV